MMIFSFLVILILYLEKIAVQSLSQSCPIDIREPVFKLLSNWTCCTWY